MPGSSSLAAQELKLTWNLIGSQAKEVILVTMAQSPWGLRWRTVQIFSRMEIL